MLISFKYLSAYSIVELLISLTLSLFALAIISSLVITGLVLDAKNSQVARLSDEIRSIASIMTREITRAGYTLDSQRFFTGNTSNCAVSSHCSPIEFRRITLEQYDKHHHPRSCIIFAYDRDKLGVISNHNALGFRLRDNAIEVRAGQRPCQSSGWADMTDPDFVRIDKLTFSMREPARSNACVTQNRKLICLPANTQRSQWVLSFSITATLVEPHCPNVKRLSPAQKSQCLTLQTHHHVVVNNVSYN